MARVFISHSSKDAEPAARIKAWLQEQGFETPFLDFDKHAGIPPGADWEKTLYREIERAEAIIIVQTPNWLESKWCFAEFTQARALGKAIFPIIETPTGDTLISADIQALDLLNDREGGLEQLSSHLTQLALDAKGGFDWDHTRPPYPGLLAFEEEDAALYFGRDDDIRRLIERLNARRAQGGTKFIAVLGSSGSGKSSLLRAGVIPRLKRAGKNWIVLPPFRPQSNPVGSLARSISITLGHETEWRQYRAELSEGDVRQSLRDIAHDLQIKAGRLDAQILIPIDSAEELFTNPDDDSCQRFFEILNAAVGGDLPYLAVMTLRSDFLEHLQASPHLTARFEEFSLGPLPLARIPQIIKGPAQIAGLQIDEALVHQAANDAGTEDALPLLAFALRELYDQSVKDKYLSLAKYKALGDPDGGLTPLENAVRKAADNVLDEAHPDNEELVALREAFVPSLVRVNQQGEYVRQPARWDDLPEKSHDLLERLARARLLVIRQEEDTRIVEVAHEALLRKWPRLRRLLDEAREFLIGKQQLERDLHDYHRAPADEKEKAFLTGLKLERARLWLEERPHQLSEDEKSFITESSDHNQAEEQRKLRIRRTITWGSLAASLVLAAAAAFSAYQWQETERAYKTSRATHMAFLASQLLAGGDPTRALGMGKAAYNQSPDQIPRSVEQALTNSYAYMISNQVAPYETKLAHKDQVRVAKFSPDGSMILTASKDGSAKLWTKDGKLIAEMVNADKDGNVEAIQHAVFTRDGKRIVTAGYGHLVRMWDTKGKLIREMVGHGCRPGFNFCNVNKVAISPDNKSIVTVSSDQYVILWDDEGGMQRKLNEHASRNGWVHHVSYSPDGKYFATSAGDWDRSTQIFKSDGSHVASLELDNCTGKKHWNCGIFSTSFAPDSKSILTASADATIKRYDLNGQHLLTLGGKDSKDGHKDTVNTVVYSPDGKTFLSASRDRTAILWNTDGTIIKRLQGHQRPVTSALYSPDGKYLATSSDDRTARVWDAQGNLVAVLQGHKAAVNSVEFSPDSKHVVTASSDGSAIVWRLPEKPIPILKHKNQIIAAHFLPDGKRVLTASNDLSVVLWDADTANAIRTYKGFGPDDFGNKRLYSLDVSPDGKRFLTTGTDYQTRLWETETGKLLKKWGGRRADNCNATDWCGATRARFTADGAHIVQSDFSGTIDIFDGEGKPLRSILSKARGNPEGHSDAVEALEISADGQSIITGSHDRTIKIWDFRTGKLRKSLTGHKGPISSVRLSSDGKSILSGSHDGTVKQWTINGDLDMTIDGHSGAVSSVRYSPKGKHIISSSFDETVKIWNLDGTIARTLSVHKKAVRTVAYSPTDERILTASEDGRAIIWPNGKAVLNWLAARSIYRLTASDWDEFGLSQDN